jgi:hypothetical protein
VLKDIAASVGRAWEGGRPGLNRRDAIRSEVRYGRALKGTRHVPSEAEARTDRAEGKKGDTRKRKSVPIQISDVTLASLRTGRSEYYVTPLGFESRRVAHTAD